MKKTVLFMCLLAMTACKNDPYPNDVKFESLEQSRERAKVKQDPTLFLNAQTLMQFVEGEEGIYEIRGITPSGKSLIEVFGLPDGASFDPDTGELKWTPNYFAANDPKDVDIVHREYPIAVYLSDADNSRIFLEKNITLLVFDKSRDMLIWTDSEAELREGATHTQDVKILNEDFPERLLNSTHRIFLKGHF